MTVSTIEIKTMLSRKIFSRQMQSTMVHSSGERTWHLECINFVRLIFFEFVASGLFTDEYDRLTDIN